MLDTEKLAPYKEVQSMDTLLKALLWTFIIVVLIIGLPFLVVLVGVAWPVVLIMAAIIFAFIAIGILIGKASNNNKGKET